MIFYLLLTVPALTGLMAFMVPSRKMASILSVAGSLLVTGIVFVIVRGPLQGAPYLAQNDIFYVDALSALLMMILAVVTLAANIYAVDYFALEIKRNEISEGKVKRFYLWYHLFVATMLGVLIVNNMGIMWVLIEATTLASALLVSFYNKKSSLEAAWKYVILCTVGITFALFGTILAYHAAGHPSLSSLNWTVMKSMAEFFNHHSIKLAFIFILVGYGTKAGLAPMHTCIPDADSEAPTPVAAVLSTALLNCALYGILRFYILTGSAVGFQWPGMLLLIFGLLSVGVAVPFIALQRDLKRMLAYSSVEHMGIIAAGIGFGGELGLLGAVLHLFNHSMAKSLFFFSSGAVMQKYRINQLTKIKGVLKSMPFTGVIFLIAGLTVAGVPPFSIFYSEFTVIAAGFMNDNMRLALFLALLLALVFGGLSYNLMGMVLGNSPKKIDKEQVRPLMVTAMAMPLVAIIIMGIILPQGALEIVDGVVSILRGAK